MNNNISIEPELNKLENSSQHLEEIPCSICGTYRPYVEFYPARLEEIDISSNSLFSARRLPDKSHFRIVKCTTCGLLYSNPIFSESTMQNLYSQSDCIVNESIKLQMNNIINEYITYLKDSVKYAPGQRLLDIGCGNGFFLKEALNQGFNKVSGVEPGKDAIRKAEPEVRPFLVNKVFTGEIFTPESFDIITAFHVLDHIRDPGSFLCEVKKTLSPNGILLMVMHDAGSWVHLVFQEKTPMIHIQHICIFDRETIRKLLEINGFEVIKVNKLMCKFTVEHATKMLPLPIGWRKKMLALLENSYLGKLNIKLTPGDMMIIARKL